MSGVKNYLYNDNYGSYGNYAEDNSDWLVENYYHVCEFPDTGFTVSYCKTCEQPGRYNFQLGKYLPEEDR